MTRNLFFWMSAIVLFAAASQASAAEPVVLTDFSDQFLLPESYWNGSDGSGGFTSGGLEFSNNYNSAWGSWDGFAYSNMTDTTTPGYNNQYSAITGGGYGGSPNYGVAYAGFAGPPTIALPSSMKLESMMVTNTTYAYLAMRDGDGFAKEFGGPTGTDPDYFRVLIEGFDGSASKGEVEFYLADYRFADSGDDYLVDTWQPVDLTPLGKVDRLELSWESTDVGDWGINTPTYAAVGQIMAETPEPSTVALLISGLLAGLAVWYRRRK